MNVQFRKDIFAGLNEVQKEAVLCTEGPVLVLAGAGSGKTRVLTHRIAHIVQRKLARPRQVLAVTFTNKAAVELKERVAAITAGGDEVAAGTFHSTMLRVLRREAKALVYPQDFSVFDNDDSVRLVKQILDDANEAGKFRPKLVHAVISRLKNDFVAPEQYAKHAKSPLDRAVAHVYPEYNRRLKILAAMDFDDLIVQATRLFREHPSVLATWSSRWRYLHVDELQDTNFAQFELLRLLAGSQRPNLFAVGDDDQSIYGWRGARVENVFQFQEAFPETKVFRLEQNYRSTQAILDLANAVIEQSDRRERKRLWTARGGGQLPEVIGLATDQDEAREVADRIGRAVMSGRRAFSDFAIMYRTNAQSRLFEEALRSRRFPYQLLGGVGFYSRKETRDALAYFKLCLNPRDDISLRRIISEPPRGIGATTLERLKSFADEHELSLFEAMERACELRALNARAANACAKFVDQVNAWRTALANEPLEKWAASVLEESGYIARLRDEKSFESQGRLDNLDSLIDSLAEHAAAGRSLTEYLEQAALATDQDKYDPHADSVRLMTIHAAKGLEFPAVFITGLEGRTFPLQRPDESEVRDPDEERRLFYVAVTRAHDELALTYSGRRRVWGQLQERSASTFLRELPEDAAEWRSARSAFTSSPGTDEPAAAGSASERIRRLQRRRAAEDLPMLGQAGAEEDAERSASQEIRDVPPDDVPAVRNGDLVLHHTYGQGIVLDVSPFRDTVRVLVEFDGGVQKRLVQSVARLQPVKDFE